MDASHEVIRRRHNESSMTLKSYFRGFTVHIYIFMYFIYFYIFLYIERSIYKPSTMALAPSGESVRILAGGTMNHMSPGAVALRPLHKLLNLFSNIINVDQ